MARTNAQSRVPLILDPPTLKRPHRELDVQPTDLVRGEKERMLKRGERPNTLVSAREFFGFAYRAEGPPEGPWYLALECVARQWLDDAWTDLLPDGGSKLLQLLGTDSFEQVMEQATPQEHSVIEGVHSRYLDMLIDTGRGTPTLGFFEVYLPKEELVRLGSYPIIVGRWYCVALMKSDEASYAEGFLREQIDAPPFLSEPKPYRLVGLGLLRERDVTWDDEKPSQAVLQALHLPQEE